MTARRINDDEAAGLYRGGQSAKEIAEHFGVTESAVSYALRRTGTPRRARGPSPTTGPVDIARAVALYRDAKESLPNVAAALGVSTTKVRRALIGAGVEIRSVGGWDDDDVARRHLAAVRKANGSTLKTIARHDDDIDPDPYLGIAGSFR